MDGHRWPISRNRRPNWYTQNIRTYGQPAYTTYTETELYNATDNIIGEGTTTEQTAANTSLEGKHGWYIELAPLS